MTDSQEHAQVTVGYDPQRDEEHKAAQHQSVTFIGRSRCHVVPRAGGHQTLWYVRTLREWGEKTKADKMDVYALEASKEVTGIRRVRRWENELLYLLHPKRGARLQARE